jgi:thioredoxin-related protein
MKRIISLFVLFAFFISININAQDAKAKQDTPKPKKEMPQSKNGSKFDPTRDSEKDLAEAIAKTKVSGKFILLDVGGEWCIWCKRLDIFFYDNEELHKMLTEAFEVVKVNWSPENKNETFLSKYPKIAGYPNFFILDKNGRFIQPQDTGVLEDGKSSYSIEKLKAFLTIWTPNKK